jgi:hypothetical protein
MSIDLSKWKEKMLSLKLQEHHLFLQGLSALWNKKIWISPLITILHWVQANNSQAGLHFTKISVKKAQGCPFNSTRNPRAKASQQIRGFHNWPVKINLKWIKRFSQDKTWIFKTQLFLESRIDLLISTYSLLARTRSNLMNKLITWGKIIKHSDLISYTLQILI